VYAKRLGVEAHKEFLIAIVDITITRRTKWQRITRAPRPLLRKILKWHPKFLRPSQTFLIREIAQKSSDAGMVLPR